MTIVDYYRLFWTFLCFGVTINTMCFYFYGEYSDMPIATDLQKEEKAAFLEEEKHFINYVGEVNRAIEFKDIEISNSEEEFRQKSKYNYSKDDYQGILEIRTEIKHLILEKEELKTYLLEPYFGRMDLESENGFDVLYVGKKGISLGNNYSVIDWRAPVGSMFYNENSTHFHVEETDYDLRLRRRIDIKSGKLIKVVTQYDASNVSLDGEIIDEFLIEVLRDKRRNYKLTDIIRTIHSKQNELIRKPVDESFVVQGCAGSGKTMILLHRLSYLKYNNHIDFSKYCILTPNDKFNEHINELCINLDVDEIKRYTVEGFYLSWIRFLARNDTVRVGTRDVPKIGALPDTVVSEKLMDNGLLKELYSEKFYLNYIEEYHKIWDNIVPVLQEITIDNSYDGIKVQLNAHNFASHRNVSGYVSDTIQKHNRAKKEYDETKEKYAHQISEYQSDLKVLEEITAKLVKSKLNLLESLIGKKDALEGSIKELNRKRTKANQELNNYNSEIDQLLDEKTSINESSIALNELERTKTDIFALKKSNSKVIKLFIAENNGLINQIEMLENELKTVPYYFFSKRSKLKSQYNMLLEVYEKRINELISKHKSTNRDKLPEIQNKIVKLEELIKQCNAGIDELEDERKKEKGLNSAIRECIDKFNENDEYPNLVIGLSQQAYMLLSSYISEYIEVYQNRIVYKNKLSVEEENIKQRSAEIDSQKKYMLSDESLEKYEKVKSVLDEVDTAKLINWHEKKIKQVYEKYGTVYSSNAPYHHLLMYKLLFCTLYYDESIKREYFICIDEAQDLAKTEYLLLRKLLGNSSTFNIYGDVNQQIYEYKEMNGWEDLADIISPNVYCINENYRNTQQITDYCNKSFGAGITSVGLSGEAVLEMDFERAIEMALERKKDYPEKRVAIIYRRGLPEIEESLSKYSEYILFGDTDPKMISVLSVEEAKGLEFEIVVTICNWMTVNEQYIADTRALENLIVTYLQSVSGNNEIVTDEHPLFEEKNLIDEADSYENRDDETEFADLAGETEYRREEQRKKILENTGKSIFEKKDTDSLVNLTNGVSFQYDSMWFKIGTIIKHNKYGEGKIVFFLDDYSVVRFSNSERTMYVLDEIAKKTVTVIKNE